MKTNDEAEITWTELSLEFCSSKRALIFFLRVFYVQKQQVFYGIHGIIHFSPHIPPKLPKTGNVAISVRRYCTIINKYIIMRSRFLSRNS